MEFTVQLKAWLTTFKEALNNELSDPITMNSKTILKHFYLYEPGKNNVLTPAGIKDHFVITGPFCNTRLTL